MALVHSISRTALLVEGYRTSMVNSDRGALLSCSCVSGTNRSRKWFFLQQAFCANHVNSCRRGTVYEGFAQLHQQKRCATKSHDHGFQCDSLRPRAEQASVIQNSSSAAHDAVVVLGGGLTDSGGIPLWGQRRLDTALELYSKQGCPILCLGGGTPHKPTMLSETGHVIHEASAYAAYLKNKGIPAKSLWKEVSSYDTVGNAYFALSIHALPAKWRRLAVVTSDFHMPRSESIFRHCAKVAAKSKWFALDFHACSDDGVFEPDVLAARQQREHESLQTWLHNAQRLRTWQQLHAYIHQEHTCYSVAHQGVFGQPETGDIDDKALATY